MELKNCPFCGSDDIEVKAMKGRKGWFVFCKCEFCGSQGKTFTHKGNCGSNDELFWSDESIRQSCKAWNKRMGCSDA